jgi:hypothetical protein
MHPDDRVVLQRALIKYLSQTERRAAVLRKRNPDGRTIIRRLVAVVFRHMIVLICFGFNILFHLLRLLIRIDRDYGVRKKGWKFLEAGWNTPEAQTVMDSGHRLMAMARDGAEDVGNGIHDAVEARGTLMRFLESLE